MTQNVNINNYVEGETPALNTVLVGDSYNNFKDVVKANALGLLSEYYVHAYQIQSIKIKISEERQKLGVNGVSFGERTGGSGRTRDERLLDMTDRISELELMIEVHYDEMKKIAHDLGLHMLTAEELQIIELRHRYNYQLDDIGKMVFMSKMQVSRILAKCHDHMMNYLILTHKLHFVM